MANRYLTQFMASPEKAVVSVYGKASITNTTGVVASYSGKLIQSVERTGAGEYTITLQDSWNSLLNASFQILAATPVDLVPQLLSYSVTSAKTVVVNLLAAAVPTDSAQDIELLFTLTLKNTSV